MKRSKLRFYIKPPHGRELAHLPQANFIVPKSNVDGYIHTKADFVAYRGENVVARYRLKRGQWLECRMSSQRVFAEPRKNNIALEVFIALVLSGIFGLSLPDHLDHLTKIYMTILIGVCAGIFGGVIGLGKMGAQRNQANAFNASKADGWMELRPFNNPMVARHYHDEKQSKRRETRLGDPEPAASRASATGDTN